MNQPTNSLLSLNLATKLYLAIGLMLVALAIVVGGIVNFTQQQASDAQLINVSGRQRMLSQRMSKASLLAVNEDAAIREEARMELIEAAALFGTSLQALSEGADGIDVSLQEAYGLAGLPAPTDADAILSLEKVNDTWGIFEVNVKAVVDDTGATRVAEALDDIILTNPTLLTSSNDVVLALEADSNRRLDNLVRFTGAMTLVTVLFAIASTLLLRRTLQQASQMRQVVDAIDVGDYSARAAIVTHDELGQLAIALNNVLDRTLRLIQSDEEKRAVQTSIMKLLDEVSTVAEGDLTVEAEVDESITGAIADSFNFMIEQLRNIISDVQEATLQVSSSANQIQTTAEHLALGSEAQASQIVDTSAAIDEMTISIQQVSENAVTSAAVGAQARSNAQEGAQAVRDTIQGMDRIRSQVEDTTKRIRRLSDSSNRIGEIVELIDDIADRTSILALNASIQAELAGDAGRSFGVVAEEVERLAVRSTQATQQISVLIRNIQSEITEVIGAMETTNHEVGIGSTLANEAGDRLQEIEQVSERLSELIQSISLAAKQQARGSETIARSMNDIADVTQQTAAGTKEATVSIGNLARLADELRSSVSTFNLPSSARTYG